MKISKVNHTRVAIGKRKEDEKIAGILYDYPGQEEDARKDVKTHIENLNKRAQNLYSCFNSKSGNKFLKKEERNFLKQMKNTVMWAVKVFLKEAEGGSSSSHYAQQLTKAVKRTSYRKQDSFPEEKIEKLIDELVHTQLRKSILPYGDIFRSVIDAIVSGDSGKLAPEESLGQLAEALFEDYTKTKRIPQMVKSIENQDMRIQPCEGKDGKRLIGLSCYGKKKDTPFSFIRKYASAGEKEQKEMLVHIRHLIILYFSGAEAYELSLEQDVTEWSYGAATPESHLLFGEKTEELFIEADNQEKPDFAPLKRYLSDTVCARYREAAAVSGLSRDDIFWLGYFEKFAEKKCKGRPQRSQLSLGYLYDHAFTEWLSYISSKYIDIGKGVYHFVLPKKDILNHGQQVYLGEILEPYKDGFTSFDYEAIKAEEMFCRDIALYTSFATHNFRTAVLSGPDALDIREDILLIRGAALEKVTHKRAKEQLLRYFGGAEKWQDTDMEIIDRMELVQAAQQGISRLRNYSFHYAGEMEDESRNKDVSSILVRKECESWKELIAGRYFSNNLLKFFSLEQVAKMINYTYGEKHVVVEQIPAFQKIWNKNAIFDDPGFIKGNARKKFMNGSTDDLTTMLKGSLFFALKEIYYQKFIVDEDAKEWFLNVVYYMAGDESSHTGYRSDIRKFRTGDQDEKRLAAARNFKNRVKELEKGATLGEICQQIMTDYNAQNASQKEVKTMQNQAKGAPWKYKHFRSLLYLAMKEAFFGYLKSEKNKEYYDFLREPKDLSGQAEGYTIQSLAEHIDVKLHSGVPSMLDESALLESFYYVVHLISPTQLNHLAGSVKTYLRSRKDICRRAKRTKNFDLRFESEDMEKRREEMEKLLILLEFVRNFCGLTTNILTDYFESEDEYAEYMMRFVDFRDDSMEPYVALNEFCKRTVRVQREEKKIGIYWDEENPIINRNILKSLLFGNVPFLSEVMEPVTEAEIREYYIRKRELEPVFQAGATKSEDEQKAVRIFQNIKNRIELLDVAIFTDIVNELYAQLIAWAYLRERDLTYFQLGFHYMKLFWGDTVPADSYRRVLKGEGIDIRDGAMLYELTAIYTYALPFYVRREDGTAEPLADRGGKLRMFPEYSGKDGFAPYAEGLSLFESLKEVEKQDEHDRMIQFRNGIDHFHYYIEPELSMLDLYSVVFDSFFRYSTNFRKSVSFTFKNILARHFVIAGTSVTSGELRIGKIKRKSALLRLSKKGLQSDQLTYKVRKPDGIQVNVFAAARSEKFLGQLGHLLEYRVEKE